MNDGKGLDSADELPACDDEEADSYANGVDPLCVRYDIGKDPTVELLRTFQLLTDENAQMGTTQSLPKALQQAVGVFRFAAAEFGCDGENCQLNCVRFC